MAIKTIATKNVAPTPELLEGLALTDEQRKLLKEAQAEYNS